MKKGLNKSNGMSFSRQKHMQKTSNLKKSVGVSVAIMLFCASAFNR